MARFLEESESRPASKSTVYLEEEMRQKRATRRQSCSAPQEKAARAAASWVDWVSQHSVAA
jgi:hypothetical protein